MFLYRYYINIVANDRNRESCEYSLNRNYVRCDSRQVYLYKSLI